VSELPGQEAERIEELIRRIAKSSLGLESLEKPLDAAVTALETQQTILNGLWQELDSLKAQVQQQTREIKQEGDILENRFPSP
jgi:peptidoglycan hydrolase CwlO-like protein